MGQDVSGDSWVWGEGEKSEQNPQLGGGCRVRPSPELGGADPEGLWGGGHSEHLRSPGHVQGSCQLGWWKQAHRSHRRKERSAWEAPPQILPGHRTCPSWGVTAHSGHLGAWAEVMPCHGVLTSSFLSFDASLTPGGAAPPSLSQSVPRDSQQRRCFWLHTRESRVHTPTMPFIGSHTPGHYPPALITPGPGSTWLWGCLYAPEPKGTGQSYSCPPCLARIFLEKPHPPRPRPPDPPGASPCIPGSPTPRLPSPLRNCHKLSSPQQSFPDGLASQYLHFYIPTVYSLSRHWQYERKDPTHLLFAPGMHG